MKTQSHNEASESLSEMMHHFHNHGLRREGRIPFMNILCIFCRISSSFLLLAFAFQCLHQNEAAQKLGITALPTIAPMPQSEVFQSADRRSNAH